MFTNLQTLAVAAVVGIGAFWAVPSPSANATALPALNNDQGANGGNGLYQDAASRDRRRQWYYDRRYHGNRYRNPYGGYRYNYGGYYYQQPYWSLTLPFVLGAPYYAQPRYYNPPPRYRNYGGAHVDWCQARYRSYNVRYNTWVSYGGDVRQCISPYGP